VTTIQRQACLSLNGLHYGRYEFYRNFGRSMVRLAEQPAWPLIELSDNQLYRLARAVRKFRRQINDPDLLFWAQRVLADATFQIQEELCQ
jgi:hypothetical protein